LNSDLTKTSPPRPSRASASTLEFSGNLSRSPSSP